ncbi:MAG: carboxylesterase family protein [Firmicutes bacterium]|nr:carboxylesterase family protein [Bacillota bacterium]
MITAKTEYGILEGKKKNNGYLFLGVPYAAPPTGERRFREAADPEPWEGIRPALKDAPACLQITYDYGGNPRVASGTSEDCLYLNVRTPAPAMQEGDHETIRTDVLLPVYVFVHGGAFEMGGNSVPLYDGRAFAERGIVYVNINYRLSVFGAMTLESLQEESGRNVTGGYCISDVYKALEWIHRNIRAFGGDPDNVTLGGESAGAFLVSLMLHTDAAGKWFQRAILESGTARGCAVKTKYGRDNYRIMLEGCRALAKELGAEDSAEGLRKLREIPAEELLLRWFVRQDGSLRGLYSDPAAGVWLYGEDRLPDPEEISAKVDLLFGFNTDEGTMFADPYASEEDYLDLLKDHYPHHWEELAARYPVDASHTPYDRMAESIGLSSFSASMLPYGDRLADSGGRVYCYHFDYLTDALRRQGQGVRHIAELHYVFHRFLRPVGGDNEEGEELAECMNRAWADFICSGDPGTLTFKNKSVSWKAYSKNARDAIRFGQELSFGSLHRLDELLYLDDLLVKEYGDINETE